MTGFDITQFMSDESKKSLKDNFKIEKVSVRKMKPSKDNFYSIDEEEITRLARTIELVGLQQNFVVRKIPEMDEYEVIAGHKRRLAVLKLLEEGKDEFELQPCKVIYTDDDIKNELTLIFTNSTQRVRTDAEKMREIEETDRLLRQLRETQKIEGRTDEIIAQLIGSSKTQVARLKKINNRLIEPLKSEYEAGNISTAAADKTASLPEEQQKEALKKYEDTGELKADDVEQLPGQMNISDFPEMVPESLKEDKRDFEKTCITGWSKYGNCVCCGANGVNCCSKCNQDCNSRCGWIPEEVKKDTDTESLIINGKINFNKKYHGVAVEIIVEALKDKSLFDVNFFDRIHEAMRSIKSTPTVAKYKINACFSDLDACVQEIWHVGEMVQIMYIDGVGVKFMTGTLDEILTYEIIAEVADAMIYTKMISFEDASQQSAKSDTENEISSLKKDLDNYYKYLTEIEKRTIQDILTVAAERGGGRL